MSEEVPEKHPTLSQVVGSNIPVVQASLEEKSRVRRALLSKALANVSIEDIQSGAFTKTTGIKLSGMFSFCWGRIWPFRRSHSHRSMILLVRILVVLVLVLAA